MRKRGITNRALFAVKPQFLVNLLRKKAVGVALIFLFILSPFFVSYPLAHAAPNYQINYQGKLTDSTGTALGNGTYSLVFKIYDTASGGVALWTETHATSSTKVTLTNGLFSVMLGSITPLTSLDFNQTLYLGVTVETDSEMSPRKVIGAVPAAFQADKIDGLDSTDFLSTSTASNSKLWSLTGLGQIGSSTATSTVLGKLATVGETIIGGILSAYDRITAPYFTATSTSQASTFPYASTTALTVSGDGQALNISSANATSTFVGGVNITKGLQISGYLFGAGLSATCSASGDKLLWANGQFSCGADAGAGGGITALGAQYSSFQNGSSQTFATSTDANVTLTITSSGNIHTFTPGWAGVLSIARGGTGTSTAPTFGQLLLGNALGGYDLTSTSSLGFITTNVAEGTNLYWTNDRFDTRLTATTSLPLLQTLAGLTSIGSTTNSTTTITGKLAAVGDSVFSSILSAYGRITAPYFTATSTSQASTFPYASTTAITATTASTSNLIVSGLGSGLTKLTDGVMSLAVAGTDYLSNSFRDWNIVGGQLTPTTTIPVKIDYASTTALTISGSGNALNISSASASSTVAGTMIFGTGLGANAMTTLPDGYGSIFNLPGATGGAASGSFCLNHANYAATSPWCFSIGGSANTLQRGLWLGYNGANQFSMNTSGNVGIGGDTSPDFKLDVTGDFAVSSNTTVNGDQFVVNSAGLVGVGTTSPSAMLSASSTSKIGLLVDQQGTDDIVRLLNSGTSRFVVTASGNVGIGTNAPTRKLTIYDTSATAPSALWQNDVTGVTNADGLRIGLDTNSNALVYMYENNDLYFGTNATERMRITSAGNVGIGTTTPNYKLDVQGGALRIVNGAPPYYAVRTDSIIFNRSDFLTSYSNKITNSMTNGGTNTSMNFELASGASTWVTPLSLHGDGYVGIGSTTPSSKLTVYGGVGGGSAPIAANDLLTVENNDNTYINVITPTDKSGGIIFSDNSRAAGVLGYSHTNNAFNMYVAGDSSKNLYLNSSGYVGIGTTTPSSKLDIYSSGSGLSDLLALTNKYASASGGLGSRMLFKGPYGNLAGILSNTEGAGAAEDEGYLAFQTAANSSLSEVMRLTSAGYMGIGTTTPSDLLHVQKDQSAVTGIRVMNESALTAAAAAFKAYNDTTTGYGWFGIGGTGYTTLSALQDMTFILSGPNTSGINIYTEPNAPIIFTTDDTERMRILGTGNVGIGTSTPNYKLTVNTGGFSVEDSATNLGGFTVSSNGRIGTFSGVPSGTTLTSASLVVNPANGGATGRLLLGVGNGGVSRFTVDAEGVAYLLGNVGVGSTTPLYPLTIKKAPTTGNNTANIYVDGSGVGGAILELARDSSASWESVIRFSTANLGSSALKWKLGMDNDGAANNFNLMDGADNKFLTVTDQGSSGNVGIGTTSPLATLDVVGGLSGTTPLLQVSSLGAAYATTTRFIVDSAGNVGIGTTSPSKTFSVGGASAGVGAFTVNATGNATTTSLSATSICFNTDCRTSWSSTGLTSYDAWTHPSYGGSATTSLLTFSSGFLSLASSTIGNGTQSGGLTILGGATTTGSLFVGDGTDGDSFIQGGVDANAWVFGYRSSDKSFRIASSTSLLSDSLSALSITKSSIFNVNVGDSSLNTARFNVYGTSTIAGKLYIGTTTSAYNSEDTTDPSFTLYSDGNTALDIMSKSANAATIRFVKDNDTKWYISSRSSAAGQDYSLRFYSANGVGVNARTTMLQSGEVGFGTTSPWRTLSVTGTVGFDGLSAEAGSDNYVCIDPVTKEVTDGGANCGASARRYKDDIQTMTYGLAEVMKLKPVSFLWNKESGRNESTRNLGLVAEDVLEVIPELVEYSKGQVQGLQYDKLTAVLAKAIQEQQIQIENLSANLATSSSNIWQVDSVTGDLKFFTALDLNNVDIKNVRAITSDSGNWSIDEEGTFIAKTVKTEKLCIGETCVDEPMLKTLLQNAGLMAAPAASGGATDPTPTPETPSDPTPSTTPETTPDPVPDPVSDPVTEPPAEAPAS